MSFMYIRSRMPVSIECLVCHQETTDTTSTVRAAAERRRAATNTQNAASVTHGHVNKAGATVDLWALGVGG